MGRWLGVVLLFAACAAPDAGVEIRGRSFGVVAQGRTHQAELELWNKGLQPAKLLRVERRSGPDVFTVTPGPVELAIGARATWRVSFEPSSPGLAQARFAAVFDTGVAEFTLRGRAALPCVTPETFDVGDARVGDSVSRTFTVSNPLDEPGEVFLAAPSAPFSVEPAGTLRLEAGASREVTVRFSPSVAGTKAAAWVVRPFADCTDAVMTLTGRALEAKASFVPGRLDFGTLPAGTSRSLNVELRNHTRAALTVSSMRFTSPAFRSSTPLPLVLPAEGAAALELEATAPGALPFDGVLTVTLDAAGQRELSLPLLVNRAAPCVASSRARVDFPGVEVTCRGRDERVRLTNDCPHEVGLGEVRLSPGFALISSPPPARLAPGEAVELAVSSAPVGEGAGEGTLDVPVDVLDGTQVVSVPLEGVGNPAVVLTESQTVSLLPWMLDVVMVIDDSPAMLPMAASVQHNLETFAQYLTSNLLDVRVAVMSTSTAPGELGTLRRAADGSNFLTNPTPSALATLGAVRGLSTARSSCLEPLLAAFTARDPAELGGLLRPGVGLFVICVTNGPDGLELAPMPVISSLVSKLPRPYFFGLVARLSNLTPAFDCGGEVEHGPLRAFVEQNNGVREEICTPDWARSLESVGRVSFGWGSLFYLQRRPDFTRGPLRMWVDDLEVPAEEPSFPGSRLWDYRGEQNAVSFQPIYSPAPGSTVRAQYTPECAR